MNEDIDISIITPSYNYAQYIRCMLDSVVVQQGVTLEHIIYDAGSTDGTLDIIHEFDHVNLIVEPDDGMSDAINKGFSLARGKWVMWLNADDKLHPGSLKEVMRFARENVTADVIYGGWHFIDEDGKLVRKMPLFPICKKMLVYMGCYIGSTATFFRRETIIEKGCRLNTNFRYVMDGEFYNRLVSEGKRFIYFPRYLADFRLHGDNLSMRNSKSSNIDNHLRRQKQLAESWAIKRSYGHRFSSDDNINGLIDFVLYAYYRIKKPLLKLVNRWRLEN